MEETKELLNTTGEKCCCCLEEFENGKKVLIMDCNGNMKHLACGTCADRIFLFNQGEEVRCPVCRQDVHTMSMMVAVNYYPGRGTRSNPIEIDG